ncbi:MAG: NAD(P)-dependent oxidoreductase [Novosphingobium sp.]
MAEVLVAGTYESKALLEQIAAELSGRGMRVTEFYGSEFGSLDPAAWQTAEILVCYGLPCGHAEMTAATKLRAIVSPTIGYEWIDEDAASKLGILVVNGAVPENHESLAEATVLLILTTLYDLPGAQSELRHEKGTRIRPRMLKGKIVGLIGFGNIAQGVVARLQGWGATFLVHRRSREQTDERVSFVSLETLLEDSDIVVVVASLNDSSRHLIDSAALDRMKQGAILINVARGGIIDEVSLAKSLADSRLSMVALDVFETEPLPDDSPLRAFQNAILTPHSIGHTVESLAAIPRASVENVLTLSRGEVPPSTRNKHIVTAWLKRAR